MSRPVKEIDMRLVRALAQRHMSKKDIAYLAEVSDDTLERRIKEEFSCTFTEFREKELSVTKARLTEQAINLALPKDGKPNITMLIFCLKTICGWGEGEGVNVAVNTQVNNVTISKEELQDRMKQLVDKHGKSS